MGWFATLAVMVRVLNTVLAGAEEHSGNGEGLERKPDEVIKYIHKVVPVPVKMPHHVFLPKFYAVKKIVYVPQPVSVPVNVPVVKKIPKFVKDTKSIGIPKPSFSHRFVNVGIPYPVFKHHPITLYKSMPVKEIVHVPVPIKIPHYVWVKIHTIITVPNPYPVPVEVPIYKKNLVKKPVYIPVPMYIRKEKQHHTNDWH